MAEKLNMGEVRCSHCKKKVMITDEHCPNCGTKTDPTGRLISFGVCCLIGSIACFLGKPIMETLVGQKDASIDIVFLFLTPTLKTLGVVLIVCVIIAGVLILVNKKMRKKAFEEMKKAQ